MLKKCQIVIKSKLKPTISEISKLPMYENLLIGEAVEIHSDTTNKSLSAGIAKAIAQYIKGGIGNQVTH